MEDDYYYSTRQHPVPFGDETCLRGCLCGYTRMALALTFAVILDFDGSLYAPYEACNCAQILISLYAPGNDGDLIGVGVITSSGTPINVTLTVFSMLGDWALFADTDISTVHINSTGNYSIPGTNVSGTWTIGTENYSGGPTQHYECFGTNTTIEAIMTNFQ